ncbi:lipoprotein [Streptomyces sodiiphilus]|uniref:Lipoprotein n=1 Tax=Streptomyces sodiiphilus TaxID=226217 RepID=A0ABN2PQT1_9ACTN
MRRRRTPLAAAAAAVTAAVLLAGCAGDGDAKEPVAGVNSGSPAPGDEAPDAEDDPDDGIDRPEIRLPEDVENVFEEAATDDPVERAVLADHERRIASLDEALTSGDLERPALGFYSEGEALRSAVEWLGPAVDKGFSFTGTVRYYQREVTLNGDTEATVSYCVDETEIQGIHRETGEKREPSGDSSGHYAYSTQLELKDNGVWTTTRVISEERDGPC